MTSLRLYFVRAGRSCNTRGERASRNHAHDNNVVPRHAALEHNGKAIQHTRKRTAAALVANIKYPKTLCRVKIITRRNRPEKKLHVLLRLQNSGESLDTKKDKL